MGPSFVIDCLLSVRVTMSVANIENEKHQMIFVILLRFDPKIFFSDLHREWNKLVERTCFSAFDHDVCFLLFKYTYLCAWTILTTVVIHTGILN